MKATLIGVVIGALCAVLVAPQPALAAGTGNVEFQVNGELDPFPAQSGRAYFGGQGTGTGHAVGTSGWDTYDASFTILAMPVSGWADYSEPAVPLCPLIGSATPLSGWISMGGPSLSSVTGVVYRAGATHTGTVTGLSVFFWFSYQRVGATASLVVNGSATVHFYYPGAGYGSFTTSFTGAGGGAFQVDPVLAALYCATGPGRLPFTFTGDVAVAG